MRTAIAVVAALAAAGCFGVASVVEQRAAREAPAGDALRVRLLRRLAGQRRWRFGLALAVASYGVQAVALAFGPLVLVQPLAATDLLFALVFVARRSRPARRQWVGAVLVTGGVSAFLALGPPRAGLSAPSLQAWVPAVAGVGTVVAVAVPVALRRGPVGRAAALAVAGASVFALLDALSKSFVDLLAAHGATTLLRWEPWALLACGVVGMVLAQSAFQAAALTVSLPIIDTVEPSGAVLIGITVFHEQIATSPAVLGGQVAAAAAALGGILLLARSAGGRPAGGSTLSR